MIATIMTVEEFLGFSIPNLPVDTITVWNTTELYARNDMSFMRNIVAHTKHKEHYDCVNGVFNNLTGVVHCKVQNNEANTIFVGVHELTHCITHKLLSVDYECEEVDEAVSDMVAASVMAAKGIEFEDADELTYHAAQFITINKESIELAKKVCKLIGFDFNIDGMIENVLFYNYYSLLDCVEDDCSETNNIIKHIKDYMDEMGIEE